MVDIHYKDANILMNEKNNKCFIFAFHNNTSRNH